MIAVVAPARGSVDELVLDELAAIAFEVGCGAPSRLLAGERFSAYDCPVGATLRAALWRAGWDAIVSVGRTAISVRRRGRTFVFPAGPGVCRLLEDFDAGRRPDLERGL